MKKTAIKLLFLLGLHLFVLVHIKFTAWPEMVSYPYLLNNGFKLYSDFIHPYPPLLTIVLSDWYRIFGYNLWALKYFTWGLILSADCLIFLIVKRLSQNLTASFLAVLVYILIQPVLDGNQLWFDLAIVPTVLLAYLMLINKKYLWAGLALAVSVLIKQTTVLFIIASAVYLFFKFRSFKVLAKFAIPLALSALALLVYLGVNGSLLQFANWVIVYPSTFWTKFPGYVQMSLTRRQFLTIAGLFAPIFIALIYSILKKVNLATKLLGYTFLIFSLVMVYPRFSFFHFQLALAIIALNYGLVLANQKALGCKFLILLIPLIIFLANIKPLLGSQSRFWDEGDIAIAKIIDAKTTPNQTIFLIGPFSNQYALARRLPAKPWADTFGWYYEVANFQANLISVWSNNMPDKVIWQLPQSGNWFDPGTYQPKVVVSFILANYYQQSELYPGVWLWTKK